MSVGQAPAPQPPECRLAELIARELGIVVNPQALRVFVRAHWHKLAGMAHAIHNDT